MIRRNLQAFSLAFGVFSFVSCHGAVDAQQPEPPNAASATTAPLDTLKDCDTCPELVFLPGGRFLMGSPPTEQGRLPSEGPAHPVTVPPFLIGRFEVTQGQWKAVMGGNRSRFADCGEACPAEQVSWEDAQLFLDRLSKVLGKRYRLPTEAEWEYAARGGSESAWPAGESAANLAEYAWFNAVSARRTHPVGSKLPNAFGLFDMSGNVWEWVEDVWHDSYANAPTDGSAWVVGGDPDRRVVRGGSWNYSVNPQRPAHRYWGGIASRDYDLGFRVARDFNSMEGNSK